MLGLGKWGKKARNRGSRSPTVALSSPSLRDIVVGKVGKKVSKAKTCPKCGQSGWKVLKKVGNAGPYLYFVHGVDGRKKWCYVRKASARDVLK